MTKVILRIESPGNNINSPLKKINDFERFPLTLEESTDVYSQTQMFIQRDNPEYQVKKT